MFMKQKNENLEVVKNVLDEQITKIKLISERINQRQIFVTHSEKLKEIQKEIETNEAFKNLFESKQFKLGFISGEYRDEFKLNIHNTFIITKFLEFILKEIDVKIIELEKEII